MTAARDGQGAGWTFAQAKARFADLGLTLITGPRDTLGQRHKYGALRSPFGSHFYSSLPVALAHADEIERMRAMLDGSPPDADEGERP